jgi:hypothetical protein
MLSQHREYFTANVSKFHQEPKTRQGYFLFTHVTCLRLMDMDDEEGSR